MRNVDRLEQQRQLRQKKRELPPPDEETEEEPRFVPLNKRKSAFDTSADKFFGGINTAPSVFSKTAVFRD